MAENNNRQAQILSSLREILLDLSGFDLQELDASASFLELGFDSLFLIQFSSSIKNDLGVQVSFRQMIEETDTFPALADHIDAQLPADAFPEVVQPEVIAVEQQVAAPAQVAAPEPVPIASQSVQPTTPVMPAMQMPAPASQAPGTPLSAEAASGLEAIMAQQLQLMSAQLAMLGGQPMATVPTEVAQPVVTQPAQSVVAQPVAAQAVSPAPPAPQSMPAKPASPKQPSTDEEFKPQSSHEMKPFGAIARIETKKSDELSPQQQQWMDDFIARYNVMTAKSKAFTTEHLPHMADPRVVSGFKSKIKELIYPLVASRTQGCRIWDVDGNEFVDALNGFGSNFFGYAHPRITQAVVDQLWRGAEIGPQNPDAGDVAKTICDFTGMDRAAFCNTGSEAVMGAMRIARTVTGRKLIVTFNGAYHGIFDEVLVRGTPHLRSMPAAPGIMPSTVENVLVLDYGTEESLQIIRERAHELAAVMIEPIQSRRPDFQPREFLQKIRKITAESGTAFIFDEVITGFRMGTGGAQEYFGIQADIGTYGKVIGGGMQIGVVAGMAKWMDALDGGPWQYGDDSVPEVGVTYFAGTFVRHPASIAACKAALEILTEEGPALQERITGQTNYLVSELDNFFRDREVPLEIKSFSSLWRMTYTETIPYSEILFFLIREKGVHIYDGFPCFLTMAHTDDDVDIILNAIKESVIDLQEAGFLPMPAHEVAQADFFAIAN